MKQNIQEKIPKIINSYGSFLGMKYSAKCLAFKHIHSMNFTVVDISFSFPLHLTSTRYFKTIFQVYLIGCEPQCKRFQ